MTDKREFLRRAAALITSLVFMFSGTCRGFITAEEAVTEKVSDNSSDEILSDSVTEELPNYDEDDDPVFTWPVSFEISETGDSLINAEKIIDELFESITVTKINGKFVDADLSGNNNISVHLKERDKYNSGETLYINTGKAYYRLDSLDIDDEYCKINLTECYDAAELKSLNAVIEIEDSSLEKLPHGSWASVYPPEGWTAAGPYIFPVCGKTVTGIVSRNDGYVMFVRSGAEYREFPVSKKAYNVSFPSEDDIKITINGTEGFEYTGAWIDSDKVSVEISAGEDYSKKIYGVSLKDTETGRIYPMEIHGNGKQVTASAAVSELSPEFEDGKKYTLIFDTVDDYIKTETYIINDDGEDNFYKFINFETSVSDNSCVIEISQLLYDKGTAKYVIDSYSCNGEKTVLDTKNLLEKGDLTKNLELPFDIGYKVSYRRIIQDSSSKFNISDNYLNVASSVYSAKLTPVIEPLNYNTGENEIRCLAIFDEIYNDGTYKENNIHYDNKWMYTPEYMRLMLKSIRAKSILYYENNEFHNMLQEPLYFYFDNHAPDMALTDIDDNPIDNSQWKCSMYEFKITCSDRETFSENPSAGDEVNDIYRNINGAYSEITQINVSDWTFTKENGSWKATAVPEKSPYRISVKGNSGTEFEVTLEYTGEENRLVKSIDVTVSDSCGNTSQPQTIELNVENEKPEIKSMAVKDAVFYQDPVYGKCAGVGIDIRTVPETVYCDFEITEEISGLKSVSVVYDGRDEGAQGMLYAKSYSVEDLMQNADLKFIQDKSKYTFRLPLPADQNVRTKIWVIVKDNAGNQAVGYLTEGAPAEKSEDAATVVFDAGRPEADISAVTYPDYTDGEERRWYSRIPDFRIKAKDTKEKVNSGIRFINFTVNGVTVKTADLLGRGEPDFIISGEHSATDPDAADIYYCAEGSDEKVKITSLNLAGTDGKLEISVEAFDAAENSSGEMSSTVYIDADAPGAADEFSIENGESSYRLFGTFLNRSIKLAVMVSEPEGKPASGLRDAVVWFDGRKYEMNFSSEKKTTAEFEIPFDLSPQNAVSGEAEIVLTDNTGNASKIKTLVNTMGSSLIVLENKMPEISDRITGSEVKYHDADGCGWYSENTEVIITADDTKNAEIYSGLRNAEISINGKELVNSRFTDGKEAVSSRTWTVNTSQSDFPDGKYEIIVRVSDNSDNPAEYRRTLAVDKTAPEITGISVEGTGSIQGSIFDGVFTLPFGHFFGSSAKITVYAADRNASAGMKEIAVTLYNFDGSEYGEYTVSGSDIRYENELYSAEFTVPEGFKGYIVACATDNVRNESEKYTVHGFITEDAARHAQTSSAVISLPETEFTDRNGTALYSGDINAVMSVSDSFSGIGGLEWNATEYGENKWRSIKAEKDGKLTGEHASGFEIKSAESNLITALTGRAALTQDRNSGVLKIKMTDNSGNISEDVKNFSIDKQPPVIKVTYGEAASDAASGIFSDQRTANVSVTERNFDPDRISVTVDGNQGGASFGTWSLTSGNAGSDSAVYTMPVTFSGNGEYVLRAEGTDMCDNRAESYESEKFVIDRTAPVLEISSSGAELKNGFCWNGPRTVTVKITEHNFDASRIHISGTADGSAEGFPEVSSFVSSGDVHTATIVFSGNADYTLRIEGEDAAGNDMESFSESFTVDGASPEISFEGVADRSANRGEISLRAFIKDDNVSEDMVSVSISGTNRGDLSESAGVMERTDEGWMFSFGEFAMDRETDDIYTVIVSAEDKAENSNSAMIVFSVNRFGSTYVFDERSQVIADTYVKKPVDIILHEINVDELNMAKTVVRVVKDNISSELVSGRDYEVELNGGSGSWCDYEYTIKASNFKEDAAYSIQVCSEDAAGNVNASSDTAKKAEFRFGVDQTPPRCVPVNIEKNGSYKADSLKAEFICEDNILVAGMDVYNNGELINDSVTGEGTRYSFMLMSNDKPQNIKIVISDAAGNQVTELLENVLVSSSLVKVVMHTGVFKAVMIALPAMGFAFAGVKAGKKRRKEKLIFPQ